jgi:hypothetical protein
MLRISYIRNRDRNVTLVLEGKIAGPWVGELHESCSPVIARGDGLTLDLIGVTFVDGNGLSLLKTLEAKDVVLARCSNFVREQLKGE